METIKVRDLMATVEDYPTISEEAVLHDAVALLEELRESSQGGGHPHRAILVLDIAGRVVGKLGLLDILRSLEPRYSQLEDLRRVSGFGISAEFLRAAMDRFDLWKAPLDDLCKKASQLRVGDIVAAPLDGESVDADASLNRAVHQMIMGRHQSLLVTAGGEVVGILKLTDVFREVGDRIKACGI